MSEEKKKDPWYERWLTMLHPEQEPGDSRKVRRKKAAAAKALNEKVSVLLAMYFQNMENYTGVIDDAGVDVNTRQELLEKHREYVLKGLDQTYRDWLRMHSDDYVYDSCASLFVARVVEISRGQAQVSLN